MGCKKLWKFEICRVDSSLSRSSGGRFNSAHNSNKPIFDEFARTRNRILTQKCPTCDLLKDRVMKEFQKFSNKKKVYDQINNPAAKQQIQFTLTDMKKRIEPIYDVYKKSCNNFTPINLNLDF